MKRSLAIALCCTGLACSDKTGSLPDVPVITLQTPGAEPRRQLRYHGTEKGRQVTVGFEVAAPEGEGMKLAAVVDWRPAADAGAGLMRRTWSVTSAKMASFPASAGAEERQIMGAIASMFSGATGDAAATGAGHARIVRTAGPPARPQIEWMLAMAVVALPAEPVGVGAKWRVVQRGAVDGSTYELDSIVELVSLDADRARVRVTGRQTEPGAPADGANQALDEDPFEMRVTGDVEIGFADFLARSGRWTVTIPVIPIGESDAGSRNLELPGMVITIDR